MQFDSSVACQNEIKRTLGLDPRMVRFSVVKIGDKLGKRKGGMEAQDGVIPWKDSSDGWDDTVGRAWSRNLLGR